MKKLTSLLLAVFVMAMPLVIYLPAYAGGSTYSNYSNFHLSASKSTATANKSDSITFTISFFIYKCADGGTRIQASSCDSKGGVAGEEAVKCDKALCQATNYAHAKITATGSGNTLSHTLRYPDSSGKATFTLKSSAAGSKTVKVSNEAPSSSYAETTKAVSFSAVKTTTTTTQKKVVAAPSTPKLATITIDGKLVDATKAIEVEQSKPLVLGGKTVANGAIKLFIFSDPQTATVKADKNGNWTYSVTDLPAGDHHIESEVTDPATGKTSERESVLAFTVKAVAATSQPQATVDTTDDRQGTGYSMLLLVAGTVVLAALAGGAFWWKKKHAKAPTQNMTEAIDAFKEKQDEKPEEPEAEPGKEAPEDDSAKEEAEDTKKDSEDKESNP